MAEYLYKAPETRYNGNRVALWHTQRYGGKAANILTEEKGVALWIR